MRLVASALSVVLIAAACTQFPQLDARIGDEATNAPFPDLVNVDPLLAQAAQGGRAEQALGETGGRLARLQARAAALRGPVIRQPLRGRMLRGVDTAALQ